MDVGSTLLQKNKTEKLVRNVDFNLTSFTDSDWVGSTDDRKST
jgi:hypothetical protein